MKKKGKKSNRLIRFWKWLWESESIWSYIVFLILVFIIVKFIFLPGLGLLMGTKLPLAIVESSSMEHHALKLDGNGFSICGKYLDGYQYLDSDKYWEICGEWYEDNTNITKEEFESFKFKNGFRKGDLMIIVGKETVDVGDVMIFDSGRSYPIIHRVVSLNPLQTKGDHNGAQLAEEMDINKEQIMGVAVGRVPYIGWIKLFFVELFR